MSVEIDGNKILSAKIGTDLDAEEAKLLASKMQVQTLADGQALTVEGDSDTKLCCLASGRLAVSNKDGNEERVAHVMQPGECAGTRAFIDGTPRKATLRSEGESTVYTLAPDDFESLVEQHPRIGYRVMKAMFRITHSNLMRANLESEELSHYVTRTGGRY